MNLKQDILIFRRTSIYTSLKVFFIGILLALGFAPFHLPGAAILGLALFYVDIPSSTLKQAFLKGWMLGLSFFGLGISWIAISVHTYGHLPLIIASIITCLFICYLAVFPGLCALIFQLLLHPKQSRLEKGLLFALLWTATEWCRAYCLTGFPWLLMGVAQIDTPLQFLLPIVGIYGVGFLSVFAATCLVHAVQQVRLNLFWLTAFVSLLVTPNLLKNYSWVTPQPHALSVGIVQANLSMRDKWDDQLFWKILNHYQDKINALMGNKQIIVLPESAIPVPAVYVKDWLNNLHRQAHKEKTAVLLGIPEELKGNSDYFYNTLLALGHASGSYRKQHLVPFGEFIPSYFALIVKGMHLDMSNMLAGHAHQTQPNAHGRPFASLICYELAYPQLLRQQLPQAQWIVSLSDDGWFGQSFAPYQHLQMAQALSLMTGRYQIVANNDGLSSIINPKGTLEYSLPAFTAGVLEGEIYPAEGSTPWTKWGDWPMFIFGLLIGMGTLYRCSRQTNFL